MPKLQAEITTRTEVDLSPSLQKKLQLGLKEYFDLVAGNKVLAEKIAAKKNDLETLFADSDEYAALEEGVRVNTPWGEVPMKIIKGMTAPRLNLMKLMKKFKLTPKDVDSCKDPGKVKKSYLAIWLPNEKSNTEENED